MLTADTSLGFLPWPETDYKAQAHPEILRKFEAATAMSCLARKHPFAPFAIENHSYIFYMEEWKRNLLRV
jgi:hypothetical protein